MATKKLTKSKKSKRIPTHKKMKLKKKIRDRKRKIRKEHRRMRRLGLKPGRKTHQDNIPNRFPYKKQLLQQMLRQRKPTSLQPQKLTNNQIIQKSFQQRQRAIQEKQNNKT